MRGRARRGRRGTRGAPSEHGKVDLTWLTFIEWRTTDFRSPIGSAEPSSVVKRFCWTANRSNAWCEQGCVRIELGRQGVGRWRRLQMERSASCVGAQVPRVFCRHMSLSEALMETTTLRLSGFSGEAMLNELPSAVGASAAWAASMVVVTSEPGVTAFSERTDIATEKF